MQMHWNQLGVMLVTCLQMTAAQAMFQRLQQRCCEPAFRSQA